MPNQSPALHYAASGVTVESMGKTPVSNKSTKKASTPAKPPMKKKVIAGKGTQTAAGKSNTKGTSSTKARTPAKVTRQKGAAIEG